MNNFNWLVPSGKRHQTKMVSQTKWSNKQPRKSIAILQPVMERGHNHPRPEKKRQNQESQTSYRLIFLLYVLGKILWRMIIWKAMVSPAKNREPTGSFKGPWQGLEGRTLAEATECRNSRQNVHLQHRTANVKMKGCLGHLVKIKLGVPQESVISPTLFAIFINGTIKNISKHVPRALHADATR